MLVFFTLLFNVVEARGGRGGRGRIGGRGGRITERAGKPGNLYGDIYEILITLYSTSRKTNNLSSWMNPKLLDNNNDSGRCITNKPHTPSTKYDSNYMPTVVAYQRHVVD